MDAPILTGQWFAWAILFPGQGLKVGNCQPSTKGQLVNCQFLESEHHELPKSGHTVMLGLQSRYHSQVMDDLCAFIRF